MTTRARIGKQAAPKGMIVPVRDAEPEGRWQELVTNCLQHVASERNRFDRLIESFGRLFQLLIVYPC